MHEAGLMSDHWNDPALIARVDALNNAIRNPGEYAVDMLGLTQELWRRLLTANKLARGR